MKITVQQKRKIAKLAKNYNLKLLYLFGSFARGDNHKNSDLDLAYERVNKKSFSLEEYVDFETEIQKILKNKCELVDLVNINNAPPLLLFGIAQDGILLYGTQKNDVLFYIKALHTYMDARPLFNLTEKYVQEKIANI
ncbi:MAG: hypothetical protein A2233_05040 [Candidatus Kerfeldbacteria bacterium RIFOXYA2_FULL_38_24]|uniref:Polymerase beta nucleotidyltransferase domain-containing protein n=1 Tax=Candidatus Kerfeldbacteria bacterium RIFOXYB2_FULL_38_14 TaxID=1798547 RepID=A0A1G2B958_9BACT|nr:MAG: hypothetical protein A2233_05040 [Candidatus Kerfeldbacteria bacterium RIFOXYA2_FULL_38_24]OGY85691.1 MAG: hypothetical protein A2319_05310 [Candidatus Kerfeldbacteria bacterium RIFOXYB2_FULL_38_14]OGY88377.1 MAG: hypothetical protein A2458_02845 [Candidatus Kerfeldbacteria bacterium RIFOXYC2_FULL_38_9]